jgi:hypothetical protein
MITLTLIGITVLVSLAALYMDQRILSAGLLRPYRTIRQQTWYEVITSGFLHASLTHLLVNMIVLFFFRNCDGADTGYRPLPGALFQRPDFLGDPVAGPLS